MGGSTAGEYPEEQRVERAELSRLLRRRDRGARIAGLTVKEPERVVPEREVRAQLHAPLELCERAVALVTEPEGSAHRPVRGGIAIVGVHAAARGPEREVDLRATIGREIEEHVLEVREREPGPRSRERRIELEGALEQARSMLVVGAAELVHVPETAVVGLPRVERARGLQDRPVALRRLDLLGDAGDHAIDDGVERVEGPLRGRLQLLSPHDGGVARLGQLDDDEDPPVLRPHRAADHVLHGQDAAGFVSAEAALAERVGRTPGDDEEDAQLGQPRDDVVRQAVGEPAGSGAGRELDERHDRDGSASPRLRWLRRGCVHRRRRGSGCVRPR